MTDAILASDEAWLLQPKSLNAQEMTVTRERYASTMPTRTPPLEKLEDRSPAITTDPNIVVSKTVTKSSPSSSSADAVVAAAKRLEEKKRELQALKEILVKKHMTGTPILVRNAGGNSHPTDSDNRVVEEADTAKSTTSVGDDAIDVVHNSDFKKETRSASLMNKGKKRRPLTLSQVKHKQRLLRMRRRHARAGFKGTLWHGIQMVASEIVFACTPMVGAMDDDEDKQASDEDDGHFTLCSTMKKTAKSVACLGKDTEETFVEDDDANSIITKSKDVNVDFMPKFKSSKVTNLGDAEGGEDETISYTAVTTNTTTLDGATTTSESITSDSLIKLLLEHQRQRQSIREALKGQAAIMVSDKAVTPSDDNGSHNIVIRSSTNGSIPTSNQTYVETSMRHKIDATTAKKSIHVKNHLQPNADAGKQHNPIVVLSNNEAIVTTPQAKNKKYQGNATADAPLLLLSDSIENFFLPSKNPNKAKNSNNSKNKKPSVQASNRIIRLLSKDSTLAVKMFKKGDAVSFTTKPSADSTLETLTDSDEDGESLNGTTYITDDDDSNEDYRDIDKKMMLQVRLAQQKKMYQRQRRLGKQQQRTMKKSIAASESDTAATAVDIATPLATTTAVVGDDEEPNNISSHSHLTRETIKCNNTTSRMTMVEDQREGVVACSKKDADDENVRDDVKKDLVEEVKSVQGQEQRPVDTQHCEDMDDNVVAKEVSPKSTDIPEQPLDAEELYKSSSLRRQRRLKDLEEMKQILGNTNRHRSTGIGNPSSHVMNHNHDDALHFSNVYDLQRASNFSVLQALRQRHLDVVRMQLQE
jgi:hypothetical protein